MEQAESHQHQLLSLKLGQGLVYRAAFEGMVTQTLLKNGVPESQ